MAMSMPGTRARRRCGILLPGENRGNLLGACHHDASTGPPTLPPSFLEDLQIGEVLGPPARALVAYDFGVSQEGDRQRLERVDDAVAPRFLEGDTRARDRRPARRRSAGRCDAPGGQIGRASCRERV